ncbi:transcription factor MYB4-like [Oryza glaberrima]|uniref:transcription factor MYB4-like n=1 Tax=Oryza glaberrima TaxID=4538 RepID=UPI00224BF223|nr:transcription factor MYB4-like [Oryza glaberrima]
MIRACVCSWSQITARLPGRSDNEIKNFWNARLRKRKKLRQTSSSLSTAAAATRHHRGEADRSRPPRRWRPDTAVEAPASMTTTGALSAVFSWTTVVDDDGERQLRRPAGGDLRD